MSRHHDIGSRYDEPYFSNDDTAKCCRCSDHFDVEMMETKDCIEFVCADCKAGADSCAAPCSATYPLFKHMSDTYQLTLIEDELQEIIAKADESRMKANGRADMVRWALVNALYHLDTEQLHELGEAIAIRAALNPHNEKLTDPNERR